MKKIFLLILALCLMLSLCACGGNASVEENADKETEVSATTDVTDAPTAGNTDAPTAGNTDAPEVEATDAPANTDSAAMVYTVNVVDEGGNPISGAMVQICQGELCMMPASTDESGVAVFTVADSGAYEAKLLSLPAGYEYATEEHVFAFGDGFEQTITLKAVQGVVYTVKVVDEGGNPISGVMVQICQGELCMMPAATDESGVATFSVDEAAAYEAKLLSLPSGYDYIAEEQVFPFGNFLELTITLKAVA